MKRGRETPAVMQAEVEVLAVLCRSAIPVRELASFLGGETLHLAPSPGVEPSIEFMAGGRVFARAVVVEDGERRFVKIVELMNEHKPGETREWTVLTE
jgi:flagellar motor switch/type III secretory pathway protein FliN